MLNFKVTAHTNNDPIIMIFIFCLLAFRELRPCNAGIVNRNKPPLWHWECVNDKCLPIKAQTKKPQSLETCNMLCASAQIWPQPTGSVSLSTNAVPVRADLFQLKILSAPSRSVHEHLRDAFHIFQGDLRNLEYQAHGFEEWHSVSVQIVVNGSGDPRMLVDTNEEYILSIRSMSEPGGSLLANITAYSFCGARHAMETLFQMIWLDPYVDSLFMLDAVKITDAPKFRYRGLLIDTARNYFPIEELMRNVDAMAASKLNTFHWHISDSQAFPLHLTSMPKMAQYGAYSLTDVYTQDEIKALVRRARLRGIRVLLEVNVPAHVGRAWNWGPLAGLGVLAHCTEAEPWYEYCNEPPCGQLNPRNEYVYETLERLYAEIIQLTGVDDVFHLGGEDISDRCWKEHFKENEPIDLWVEFAKSALKHLEYVNGKLPNLTIFWVSRLSERLKTDFKEYVHSIGIQTRGAAWSQKYISGIRTVVSHEDPWDFNSGLGAWYEESGGAPYNSWQRVYEHRPWVKNLGGVVQGGEATIWSTTLGDGGLDGRMWPRAAALAERLWTDLPESVSRLVHARLDVHRSRLIARGTNFPPLWATWCTHNIYNCM